MLGKKNKIGGEKNMKKGMKLGLVLGTLLIITALISVSNVSACFTTELIAGQDWDNPVGLASIYVDNEDRLNIKIETPYPGDPEDACTIVESHVFVGDSLDEVPQNKKGNLKIGKFPFNQDSDECAWHLDNLVWYQIPISEIDTTDGELIILIHTVVDCGGQEETAWADTEGEEFPGSSWALYLEFTI
jgi:hypothetical protein